MNRIDLDLKEEKIVIYSFESDIEIERIKKSVILNYFKVLSGSFDLFAYKSPEHSPCSFSLSAGRYNYDYQGCSYTAESMRLAQLEVPSFELKILYRVNTPIIYYLDLFELARDYNFTDTITQHVSAGGWEPTQKLQSFFTNHLGLTALRVPSSKNPHEACIDFYASSNLPDGFFIEVRNA